MVMRNKLVGIAASVLLAAVGTILLVVYVVGAEDRALQGEQPVEVLVVADAIPKGTRAEDLAGMVRSERVPAKVAAEGATTGLESLAGQQALVDLMPGEQVVRSRFAPAAQAGLVEPPPGMLQVTVALDTIRALGGQVRAGDTVGVVASFDEPRTSHLILHKVPVTGVRTDQGVAVTSGPQDPAPAGNLLITLALDGPSVEGVVFAAEHGRLWLTSEPMEAVEDGTKIQTIEEVNG
jgi:pilus assembly protein CpaB